MACPEPESPARSEPPCDPVTSGPKQSDRRRMMQGEVGYGPVDVEPAADSLSRSDVVHPAGPQFPALLTPAEVAVLFHVDPKTVGRWAAKGRLRSVRTPGGHRRFLRSEVEAALYAGRRAATDPALAAITQVLD